MASERTDWLEALAYPALLVDASLSVVASNGLAPSVRSLSDAAPELRAALARRFAEEGTTRLAGLAFPPLPPCTVHVTPAPGDCALVMFEHAHASALGGDTYTEQSATMAAMLAHEVRNPLLSIRGAAQLLEGQVREDDAALPTLIIREVGRIEQLMATLDPLAVAPPTERPALNIHEPLEHARRATEASFGPGIVYAQQYDPSLPFIAASHDALVQAFTNLLKNAAEAVENAAAPRITLTTRYTLGETRRNAQGMALPIAISVADNGSGVPPRLEEKLFAPFVTTKVLGKGLGLAIVARIVEEHGGLIAHDRPEAGGARFTLYLPAAA